MQENILPGLSNYTGIFLSRSQQCQFTMPSTNTFWKGDKSKIDSNTKISYAKDNFGTDLYVFHNQKT